MSDEEIARQLFVDNDAGEAGESDHVSQEDHRCLLSHVLHGLDSADLFTRFLIIHICFSNLIRQLLGQVSHLDLV